MNHHPRSAHHRTLGVFQVLVGSAAGALDAGGAVRVAALEAAVVDEAAARAPRFADGGDGRLAGVAEAAAAPDPGTRGPPENVVQPPRIQSRLVSA